MFLLNFIRKFQNSIHLFGTSSIEIFQTEIKISRYIQTLLLDSKQKNNVIRTKNRPLRIDVLQNDPTWLLTFPCGISLTDLKLTEVKKLNIPVDFIDEFLTDSISSQIFLAEPSIYPRNNGIRNWSNYFKIKPILNTQKSTQSILIDDRKIIFPFQEIFPQLYGPEDCDTCDPRDALY